MTPTIVPWIVRHKDGHVAAFSSPDVTYGQDIQEGHDTYFMLNPNSEYEHGYLTHCCPAHWLFNKKDKVTA